jgi:PAS domain S-box-containing protein
LRASSTAAEEILEDSPCGLAVIGLDGTVRFANPAFLSLTGLTKSSASGCRFQDLLTVGGTIFYETQFAPTLLMRGAVSEISLEILQPCGKRVPVFVNAVLRSSNKGEPSRILMALFEAGQRRLYENELLRARKESEQIAEVVRRSSDAIIRMTSDGVMQSWNSGAERVFGFSSAEAVGQTLLFLCRGEAQQEIDDAISQLKRGVEVNRELVGFHKNGHAMDLSLSMTPHLEAPGILVGFSAIIRDITARKAAEKAILQSEKLASVGRLASSIAHEINNPLESVTNLLYILQSRPLDAECHALVSTAQEELARVSQIATHTLRFHKQSTRRTQLDLKALSDSVLALYRARLKSSGITAINESYVVSPLLCFEGELRQILINLVANAFDAMRSGGRLILRNRDVTLWPSGLKGVRITVADTGSGIDEAALPHIFEPFFSTKGIGGTGLGLWIAHELIEKNQGTIQVRSSTRPGRNGTVMSMFFPHSFDADIPA